MAGIGIDWMLWLLKARQLDALLQRELQLIELSLGEYEILYALREGPLPQTGIRELTSHSEPSISRHLKRFEHQGWVSREMDVRDRRRLLVSLTSVGLTYLHEADRSLERAAKGLVDKLDVSEVRILSDLYRRIEGVLTT